MAFSLPLPAALAAEGWKVKIRDRERCETPHATIIRRMKSWRVSLRDLEPLDRSPLPRDVPDAVMGEIEAGLPQLIRAWNQMYPENPV